MKLVMKLLALFFGVLLGNVAHAETPSEQLQQMVEQLRKMPNDNALREKIIRLATSIKPALAIPEEAREPFVMGATVLKKASDPAGASKAVDLFTQALNIAPWFADAYYNRAIAREAAGQFEPAIDDLKLYLGFKLADSERREAQDKIYALKADAQLASAKKAEAEKTAATAEQERQRPSTEGEWIGNLSIHVIRNGEKFTIIPGMVGMLGNNWRPVGVEISQQRVRFGVAQPQCPACGVPRYDVSLSASGNELVGTLYGSDGNYPAKFIKQH